MKPVNVNTYINSSKEINDKNAKFKIGDIAKISKYNTIFAKGYVSNEEEVFVIKKLKILLIVILLSMLIVILKAKKLLERFTKKNCKKQLKKSLKLKKLFKKRR